MTREDRKRGPARNRAARCASAIMVAALATTCWVGGTLAKYVTTDSAKDTARVARFGVVASATGSLFGASYSGNADGNSISKWSVNSPTVSSSGGTDDLVVAPGTKNEQGMTFTVKGTPEVSTSLSVSGADGIENTDIYLRQGTYWVMASVSVQKAKDAYYAGSGSGYYVYDEGDKTFELISDGNVATATDTNSYRKVSEATSGATYLPVKWKVNNQDAIDSVSGVAAAVIKAVTGENSGATATRPPNKPWEKTADGSNGSGSAKVTWEWPFGGQSGIITDVDKLDTVLGDMVALAVKRTDSEDLGYKVAFVEDSNITNVTFEEIPAASSKNNMVWVAKKDSNSSVAVSSWNDANALACLTVSYGAKMTVEQVD